MSICKPLISQNERSQISTTHYITPQNELILSEQQHYVNQLQERNQKNIQIQSKGLSKYKVQHRYIPTGSTYTFSVCTYKMEATAFSNYIAKEDDHSMKFQLHYFNSVTHKS